MSEIKVKKIRRLDARIRVPGDKSISHRAVMLGGLARGTCKITGFLPSEDCLCSMRAMQALGAKIEQITDSHLEITGVSGECRQVLETIDCGNSGTSMRLLAGILAAQPFTSRLSGDSSLTSRPMRRVMIPLMQMGAFIESEMKNERAPLRINGGRLHGINYKMPVASAQVKSCILLAGMFAEGTTSVTEPMSSRDHTERMLRHFLVPSRADSLQKSLDGKDIPIKGGVPLTTVVHGGSIPEARDFRVPGDFSSAAFWLVAASAFQGSQLSIEDVGLNKTRTGLLSVLMRMGAQIREYVETGNDTEPHGNLEITGRGLHATTVDGDIIPNVIDEIPAIAVLAALAEGETIIKDAGELRVKESDRIASITKNLRAFGVPVEEAEDGMIIQGGKALKGTTVDCFGDHRIAMAFSILGLFAEGETRILNTECIRTSYPGFEKQLEAIMS